VYTAHGTIKTLGNTFMIIDKYSYQKYTVIERPLMHDWMHITGDLDPIMKAANLSYNTIYEISNGDFITKIVHDIELEELRSDKYSSGINQRNVEKLFLLLGRAVNDENPNVVSRKVWKAFLQIRTQIHQSYSQKWDIDTMAKQANLSRTRFCELYRQIFGISPKKDLQNVRIEHAKLLLSKGDCTVKEIAEMIGYDTEYYFIRKFKEITGKTPGHYLKTK
jgi:AraC-like DNA-binding protein